jgi:hypothetical protein
LLLAGMVILGVLTAVGAALLLAVLVLLMQQGTEQRISPIPVRSRPERLVKPRCVSDQLRARAPMG